SLQDKVRIDADELAVVIGVAIAGTRRARLDVAHHRTSIAADLVGRRSRRFNHHIKACKRTLCGKGQRRYRSYTNNPPRAPTACQAARAAKTRGCRIIAHLPRPAVHKGANACGATCACTSVHKRYSPGVLAVQAWGPETATRRRRKSV